MSHPTDNALDELHRIVKSHACTQVNFDEMAREDYPKMIAAIQEWSDKRSAMAQLELGADIIGRLGLLGKDPVLKNHKTGIVYSIDQVRQAITKLGGQV